MKAHKCVVCGKLAGPWKVHGKWEQDNHCSAECCRKAHGLPVSGPSTSGATKFQPPRDPMLVP